MRTLPGGTRRWITAGAMLTLLALTATGCYGTWGVRESYRNYIGTGVGTEDGATHLPGTGPGGGAIQWNVYDAHIDPSTHSGSINFSGGVSFQKYPVGTDHVLDMTIWNPRLEFDGATSGTLVVDLTYREFVSIDSPAPIKAATEVDFATVDLSGFNWTAVDNVYTITDAPMTGIPAAMAQIGWDAFYPGENPIQLDPLSVSVNTSVFTPVLFEAPRITVSKTTDLNVGDQVVVWGRGFDPDAHTGTRPPFSGQKSGAYVIFGRFADNWQPSTGAGSGSRTVIDQKWAVPEASRLLVDPTQTNASYVNIDQYGNFEAVLTISSLGTGSNPNYGIYTYPGSGATNALYELSTPVTVG